MPKAHTINMDDFVKDMTIEELNDLKNQLELIALAKEYESK